MALIIQNSTFDGNRADDNGGGFYAEEFSGTHDITDSNPHPAPSSSHTINGNSGADTIFGGSAGDTINGGTGRDTINGESGPDTIFGGSGVLLYLLAWLVIAKEGKQDTSAMRALRLGSYWIELTVA